jgi:hypothetical protein
MTVREMEAYRSAPCAGWRHDSGAASAPDPRYAASACGVTLDAEAVVDIAIIVEYG